MSSATRFEFQAEARQVLELMIHSVYSNKEIFLRELISNASDALDKLRFEALTHPEYKIAPDHFCIRIERDEKERVLSVQDNGIGMNREEIIQYLGTIAKSGTKEFLRRVKESGKNPGLPELIGQFGVGFYSSFMVADRVIVVSRKMGEEKAWRWESSGDGSYTLEPAERDEPGTTVSLHLKKPDPEDHLEDFLDVFAIRRIVKKYSDFVSFPIRMKAERTEVERDENGKPKEGATPKTVVEDETLNSMKAIWARPPKEISEEEYKEFYRHVSHDWNDPFDRIHVHAEGTSEFKMLLYLPAKAPFDLFLREAGYGAHLYIRRVFIMNDCKELFPRWLRFLKGVLDSEDLTLNVSREILQQNRHMKSMRRAVIRKTLEKFKSLLAEKRDPYAEFWKEFGRAIKEGLFEEREAQEELLGVCLFKTTNSTDKLSTLDEYISRMKPGQDSIFYLTGETRSVVENSPHLESAKAKGYEVLILDDPVDEVWVQYAALFKEKKFRNLAKGEIELGSAEERKEAGEKLKEKEGSYKDFLAWIGKTLEDRIREARLSARLTNSPVCLVSDEQDMSPQLEAMLKASGREVPSVRRILEINPTSPVIEKLRALREKTPDDATLADYAELLYGHAVLSEGGQLPDPAGFAKRLSELLARTL